MGLWSHVVEDAIGYGDYWFGCSVSAVSSEPGTQHDGRTLRNY